MIHTKNDFYLGLKLLRIVVFLLPLTSCFYPTIIPIKSFFDIPFDTFNEHCLIAIDVDETLVQPIDPLFYVNSYKALIVEKMKNQFLKDHSHLTIEDWTNLASIILQNIDIPLIEPTITLLIKKLQTRGVPVIALTAMNTGRYGFIPSMEQWRYNHLKSLGFIGSYNNKIISFDQKFTRNPIFYRGMFATDLEQKGPVLGALIDRLRLKPQKIIFIDDNYKFVQSVEHECKKRGISFIGYWYQGAKEVNPDTWNWDIIAKQITHLVNQQKYIAPHTLQAHTVPESIHPLIMKEN